MGQLLAFPTQAAIDAAWERYRALAVMVIDDPRLAADRHHMEALARTKMAWEAAFSARSN